MFVTDSWFVQPARKLLNGMTQLSSPVFQYQFSRENREFPRLGASHAIDLRYVFNTLEDKEKRPEDQALANSVTDNWVQFARTGDPNKKGLPQWPNYTDKHRAYLDINHEISTGVDLKQEACDVLDAATTNFYSLEPN